MLLNIAAPGVHVSHEVGRGGVADDERVGKLHGCGGGCHVVRDEILRRVARLTVGGAVERAFGCGLRRKSAQ